MMKRILKVFFAISLLVCFIFYLKATDVGASVRLIMQLGIQSSFILLFTFLAYLFGTLGWSYCIDSSSKSSLMQLFIIRHTGNTITLFNPASAIAGEFFNARMLIKKGVDESNAYKSVVLSRLLMTFSQLFLFFMLLIWYFLFFPNRFSIGTKLFFYGGFFFLLLTCLFFLVILLKTGRFFKKENKTKKWEKVVGRMREIHFLLAEHIRRRPKATMLAFFFFCLQWFLNSLELFFILSFFKYNITVWESLFLDTSIILLKSTVSFIPGQLGFEELINRFSLHLVGIDSPEVWLSVSVLRRSRQLIWTGLALFFYLSLKKQKREMV